MGGFRGGFYYLVKETLIITGINPVRENNANIMGEVIVTCESVNKALSCLINHNFWIGE